MKPSGSADTLNEPNNIDIDQLLALRHVPAPPIRTTPFANAVSLGAFRSAKRGHGIDYDDIRQYSAGDDIRHIDWRASARMQALHTRLYREEKDHQLSLICDLRADMFTGSTTLRAHQVTLLCASIIWHACKQGSRISLHIITDRTLYCVHSGIGHPMAIRACGALAARYRIELTKHHAAGDTCVKGEYASATADGTNTLFEENSNTDAIHKIHAHALPVESTANQTTLNSVCKHLKRYGEYKACVIWLTGMDGLGDNFYDTLGASTERCTQAVIHIDDALLSEALKEGVYYYKDETEKSDTAVIKAAHITRAHRLSLQASLDTIKQQRIDALLARSIPYFSTSSDEKSLIASLRHLALIP